MKQCAFTIVAKNYIGLGQILGKSLRRHNPEIDFHIYVADEFTTKPEALPKEVIIAKEQLSTSIAPEQWTEMAFKYDLTEFCTAIKPFCFEHAFSLGYDKVYYFDPDIFVFAPITEISDALDTYSMTLTPQIAGIHVNYSGEHPEWAMNVNGIFNLGFCGIRNNDWGKRMVQWWKERLRDQAFADRAVGQFTDQKWMDWAPALLGHQLHVLTSLGMNMAPWNYFEREIHQDANGTLWVSFRTGNQSQRHDPLVFVHFAGYDYSKLKQGLVVRKRIEDLKEYDDLAHINTIYRDAIMADAPVFDAFIDQPYTYASYDNGTPIATFHRRLFHGLTKKPDNPFDTSKSSFYQAIKQKGMVIEEKIDNISRRNMGNLDSKVQQLSLFYRLLYRLLGYKRYVMFLKSLYFFCRPEMHTFLIGKKRLLSILMLFTFSLLTFAAETTMPIIAYMGVANNQSTDSHFKTFSDCGFNVSLYGYSSLKQMTEACNIAQKHGVRILGHCPETHATPEKAAAVLKNNSGFFGYVLQDEPSADEIRKLQKEIKRIKTIDDSHCFYINLHPYYAEWTLQNTRTRSYDEYLNVAAETDCQQLSFDYYPVTRKGLRDGWYSNLEAIRQKSLQTGLPFWGFVLSVPHNDYPQPTLGTLRLQVYSNLVYGAQAIQYFTYWTPKPEGQNDYHNGPVDQQGKITKTYYIVQKMNNELRSVAPLFYGAKVHAVNHMGVIARGTARLTTIPSGLSTLKIAGKQGAIVSQFENNGHTYIAIVNKDYKSKMKVTIKAHDATPRYVDKQLKEEKLQPQYNVAAGDVLIVRLK